MLKCMYEPAYRVYPMFRAFSVQLEAETLPRCCWRWIKSNTDGSKSRTPEKHQGILGGEENTRILSWVYSLSGRGQQWQLWCTIFSHLPQLSLLRKHHSSPFSKTLFPAGMHSKEILCLIHHPLSGPLLPELLCTTYSLVFVLSWISTTSVAQILTLRAPWLGWFGEALPDTTEQRSRARTCSIGLSCPTLLPSLSPCLPPSIILSKWIYPMSIFTIQGFMLPSFPLSLCRGNQLYMTQSSSRGHIAQFQWC